MKLLQAVVIACSLSAAAVAHAQTAAPTQTDSQQVAQAKAAPANSDRAAQRPVATPAKKADDCVGPVSFCNIFFGS